MLRPNGFLLWPTSAIVNRGVLVEYQSYAYVKTTPAANQSGGRSSHTEWRSKDFQCSLYGKLYSDTYNCQRHINKHHSDRPNIQIVQAETPEGYMTFKDFRCSVCGMLSKTRHSMINHINATHQDEPEAHAIKIKPGF